MEEAGRLPASQRVWDRKPEHLVRTHGWRRDSNLTVAARRWSLFGSAAAQYCSRDCCPHLLALLIVAWSRGWLNRSFVRTSTVTVQSVAVLPLDNLSGDQEQDFFADGMTDELITMLAKTSSLRVCVRENIKAAERNNCSVGQPVRNVA